MGLFAWLKNRAQGSTISRVTQWNRLAVQLHRQGFSQQAIGLATRARALARQRLGPNHPLYATSLSNLAVFCQAIGEYAIALPLCRRAAEIRRAALGEKHPDYAASLNTLAVLYQRMGNFSDALPLCRQAAEICRNVLGEKHPDYAQSLNILAVLYQAMGNLSDALPLCRQAVEIRRTVLGENHPHHAQGLNNLAVLYQAMGDHTAAFPLCRRAVEIYRTALGEKHPDYANSLNNLAALYAATGRPSEALTLMEQAASIDDRTIGQVLAIGSDRQRIAYLKGVLYRLYQSLSLVQQHLTDSPAAVRAALDLVLRRKAVAAEALATQRDAVLGGKYPALGPRLHEVAALRMQIARNALAGPGPEGLEYQRRLLAEWNARKETLEAELAGQIPELNMEQQLRAADRRAVALGLPEGFALVEFVHFLPFDFRAVPARGERRWKSARYMAFVLPGGAPDEVRMIDVGEAKPIDQMIDDFRAGVIAEAGHGRNMARRREGGYPSAENNAGSALRAVLFDRLTPAFGGHTRLLIAPEGGLTRLPFEVLPTVEGRRLLDNYHISYLSCGRDVLRFGAAATGQPGRPLVIADPDFDLEIVPNQGLAPAEVVFWPRRPGRDEKLPAPSMPPVVRVDYGPALSGRGERAPATAMQPVPGPATGADPAVRRSRELERDRRAYHFHRLRGTRAEGEWIASRLGVSPWVGATALEGRLKSVCRSPLILHLATHGFFLPDQPGDPDREGRDLGFDLGELSGEWGGPDRLSGPMMEDPMLRSGLALAGANTWLRAGNLPGEAEDGLLIAEDVTGLDLLATELVVLSACETGLGQVHVGEGVFGLRRAFVLAGAKTLVMSLWKVPDDQTRELMEDYYRRLLAGEGRAEALRQAQLAMKAKYPEPHYWGAFICQGDPGPLGPPPARSKGPEPPFVRIARASPCPRQGVARPGHQGGVAAEPQPGRIVG
jgi:tetratricopeptide (TPR) repeat protein